MKKTEIIKKNYEFKYFFKKGKYYSGSIIEVYLFNNTLNVNKLGIVVSKKIGGSVIRNKIKRYIRSAYTDIEDDINTCCNLLIVWKKSISHEKANYFDIKNELISILKSSNNIGERI